MQQKLGMKALIVLGLIVFLMIPLILIEGIVDDRIALQQQVQQEIARSSSAEQKIIGPLLKINFKKAVATKDDIKFVIFNKVFLPEQLKISSSLDTYEKYRGIYKALLYQSKNEFLGEFLLSQVENVEFETIESISLAFAISDIRGIQNTSHISINGKNYSLEPGTDLPFISDGIHVKLPVEAILNKNKLNFNINLSIQGMKNIAFSPLGKTTQLNLQANWQHPSFYGEYLPINSNITDEGFSAHWQTNYFATNMQDIVASCMERDQCGALYQRSFGVNMIDSVDQYLKSYRAINYALLFIVLTFSSFLLLEIFKAIPIHPVQYGFVGLALAVFYLLLLSLSEHIGFNFAYAISALSCSSVLGVYVGGIFKSKKEGGYFSIAVVVLYILLFALLSAENFALLMGSILIFIILSLLMVLTRKVNWYDSIVPQEN
ncbi:cell envelope integrity protein CreD [Pseudoalteromonas denitrificans]|uniref:Inner membrane protein n=1 Tax=Pseudoalteromonas denitrificans DSM 6059 TaxID=1123010 RepID=A0A1I1KH48_9GAMM|nr:cell envelope integrity protein CreD [Pseudoalteromonas denitrificans]SFC60146.1 inner membrane protein [Pseudoalteromonas denitrificans DSM 6059]